MKPSAGYHLISSEQSSLSQLGVSLGLLAAQLRLVVEEVREESRRLGPARERLAARYELYRESFQLDLGRYQAQSERRDRITSGKMVTGWVRSDEELGRGVEEVTARLGVVLATLEEEAATLAGLTGEVEGLVGGQEEDGELAGLVERSLAVLAGLRRERPGSRQDSTARQVAQLLVRMLKRRDGRLRTLGGLLARLTDCLSSLTDLGLAVSLLAKDISQTDTGLVRTQLRRQTDVWTLLSAAVSHRPASDLGLVEQQVELNNVVIRKNMEVRGGREGED